MESLNFTQFCDKNGYASNYDILNHSVLSPSGHISKRAKNNELKSMRCRIDDNLQAHAKYEALILSGAVVDPSGDYTRNAIVNALNGAVLTKINGHKTNIEYILSLGTMAHTKTGKLKIGYKRTIDDYKDQISALQLELIK